MMLTGLDWPREELAQAQVVIDDQDFGFGFIHGLNPSRIAGIVPAGFTNDYKPGSAATIALQPLQRMQACLKSGIDTATTEAIMKALFFGMTLAIGLALWGADSPAAVDQLMAASHVAGEQVYNIFR